MVLKNQRRNLSTPKMDPSKSDYLTKKYRASFKPNFSYKTAKNVVTPLETFNEDVSFYKEL